MKNFVSRKRSRALFSIGIIAISIGLISIKVTDYPNCMKGTQELTFKI